MVVLLYCVYFQTLTSGKLEATGQSPHSLTRATSERLFTRRQSGAPVKLVTPSLLIALPEPTGSPSRFRSTLISGCIAWYFTDYCSNGFNQWTGRIMARDGTNRIWYRNNQQVRFTPDWIQLCASKISDHYGGPCLSRPDFLLCRGLLKWRKYMRISNWALQN
jgi:hypothetical protein